MFKALIPRVFQTLKFSSTHRPPPSSLLHSSTLLNCNHDRKFSTTPAIRSEQSSGSGGSTTNDQNIPTNNVKHHLPKEQLELIYDRVRNELKKSDNVFKRPKETLVQTMEIMRRKREENPENPLPRENLDILIKGFEIFNYYLTLKTLVDQDKFGIVEDMEQMKRDMIGLLFQWSYHYTFVLKSVYQEWFRFEDIKNTFPPVSMKINIEGKDIVHHDQVTYYSALCELLAIDFVNATTNLPSKETLICMVSVICYKLSKPEFASELMQSFVLLYPLVKQRYTTPYEGDIDNSWTDTLGKVYSEDEFDWYQDLETDLPVHLGGMCNIFKVMLIGDKTNEHAMKVMRDEGERAPNNPYIPYLKFSVSTDMTHVDKCLEILSKSTSTSRFEDLKRVELFGVFKNEKPSQTRIKDFKFIPQLLIKVHAQSSNLNSPNRFDGNELIDQVEYYSRIPTHTELLITKFMTELKGRRFENALQNYQCLQYFEETLTGEPLLHLTSLAGKAMIGLGYKKECIEVIEGFVQKYGHSEPRWAKMLEIAKQEIEKSK